MAYYQPDAQQQQQYNNNNSDPYANYNKNVNNNTCFICGQAFSNDESPTWEKWVDLKDDQGRKAHPGCFRCAIW